ncbi:Lanthionine synthetase C-like [Trinorchestia longiramus]|nr:Lanthionine synthetase C-like [Trinorchestia longiramus]
MNVEPKRYFLNHYPDHEDGGPSTITITPEKQKEMLDMLVNIVLKNFTKEAKHTDGGLYVGLAGGGYMMLYLSQLPGTEPSRQLQYLQEALSFLKRPIQYMEAAGNRQHITDRTGFLTGNVGIMAVAAVVRHKLGQTAERDQALQQVLSAASILQEPNWFANGGDELFVGRAGFLCAILWLRKHLNTQVYPDSECHRMLLTMLQSGLQYSKATNSPLPLMYHYYGTQYLGAAHGLAGILLVMLSFPEWLQRDAEVTSVLRQTVDGLAALQQADGNFPCAMDEVGSTTRPQEDELVHWCHGAPGMIYLFAKAYTVFNDSKYLDVCIKCGEVTWQKGLLKKGAGICHGIAGSGFVFLLLYRLTGDLKYIHRSKCFAKFIFSETFRKARTPDCPFSLFEGLAGTVCYLGDMLAPHQAAFPFFDLI